MAPPPMIEACLISRLIGSGNGHPGQYWIVIHLRLSISDDPDMVARSLDTSYLWALMPGCRLVLYFVLLNIRWPPIDFFWCHWIRPCTPRWWLIVTYIRIFEYSMIPAWIPDYGILTGVVKYGHCCPGGGWLSYFLNHMIRILPPDCRILPGVVEYRRCRPGGGWLLHVQNPMIRILPPYCQILPGIVGTGQC